MRIIGIDPGYAIVGVGVLDCVAGQFQTVGFGAITTEAGTPLPERLKTIHLELEQLLSTYKPDCMAVEKLFFTNNRTTGIDVAQARGVVLTLAALHGIPVYEYTPGEVKQAVVGYGSAVKHQVMEMTKEILHLPKAPKPDDVCDALAVAICHGNSIASLGFLYKN